jgi:hypothetical protein
MQVTYDKIKEIIESKGYVFFNNGKYNLNIFGIRANNDKVNEFNDFIGIAYLDTASNKVIQVFNATTKPGLFWLKNKLGNINGTAILIPGQYRGCWRLGYHKGYQALTQNGSGKFKVWRDNDSDGDLDMSGRIYSDVTGLNLHTTSFINEIDKVGAYSAGCQVIQDDLEFNIFLSVIKKSSSVYGDTFSYSLLEENDF